MIYFACWSKIFFQRSGFREETACTNETYATTFNGSMKGNLIVTRQVIEVECRHSRNVSQFYRYGKSVFLLEELIFQRFNVRNPRVQKVRNIAR